MHEKLTVSELVDLESTLQFYADKFGLIITAVPTDGGKHMFFTPSEPIKLSDVIFPTEFLEGGE
jgi:hypothetical protein